MDNISSRNSIDIMNWVKDGSTNARIKTRKMASAPEKKIELSYV